MYINAALTLQACMIYFSLLKVVVNFTNYYFSLAQTLQAQSNKMLLPVSVKITSHGGLSFQRNQL